MKMNLLNRTGMLAGTLAAAALALGLACSSGPRGSQPNPTGQHPSDWVQTHWIAFNQNKTSCVPCHGSYTDPNSTGGTTGINCFSCHAQQNPVVYAPLHPAGWQTIGNTPFHGTFANGAASLSTGFAHCASCHGGSYNNADGKSQSCMTCHTNAPHPDKPWHGTTGTGSNHARVDPSNVAECAKCHLNGANLDPNDLPFRGTPAPGAAPGCFNNTLCHGDNRNPAHNGTWITAAGHGYAGAMAATPGFAACVTCHGPYVNPTGGTSTVSCRACHTTAPHPAAPWDDKTAGTVLSHVFVNQSASNLAVCFGCHAGGQNTSLHPATPAPGAQPGCLNNTMCHDANI